MREPWRSMHVGHAYYATVRQTALECRVLQVGYWRPDADRRPSVGASQVPAVQALTRATVSRPRHRHIPLRCPPVNRQTRHPTGHQDAPTSLANLEPADALGLFFGHVDLLD